VNASELQTGAVERHCSLECLNGKYEGRVFRFVNEATIGRSGDNTILLDEMVISMKHARLYFDSALNRFLIEDLGSRTGIAVNGEFVNDRCEVRDGERITIGNLLEFRFAIDAPGGENEPAGEDTGSWTALELSPSSEPATETEQQIDAGQAPRAGQAPLAGQAPPAGKTGAAAKPVADGESAAEQIAMEEPPALIKQYVLVRKGHENASPVALEEGINLVGRDHSNKIVLPDASVSRHHAVVVVKAGNVSVRDLDSKNNTFVDGERGANETAMQPGSEVMFGLAAFDLLHAQ